MDLSDVPCVMTSTKSVEITARLVKHRIVGIVMSQMSTPAQSVKRVTLTSDTAMPL